MTVYETTRCEELWRRVASGNEEAVSELETHIASCSSCKERARNTAAWLRTLIRRAMIDETGEEDLRQVLRDSGLGKAEVGYVLDLVRMRGGLKKLGGN